MELWCFIVIVLLLFYIAQVMVILAVERIHAARAVAWSVIVLVCPLFGFAAYWIVEGDFKRLKGQSRFEKSSLAQAMENLQIAKGQQTAEGRHYAAQERVGSIGKGVSPHETAAVASSRHAVNANSEQEKLFHMLTAISQSVVTQANEVGVLTNGAAFFPRLLDELAQAKQHIHLDFYTLRDDGIGNKVLDILVEKAKAGVEVRVLYDGLGSLRLSKMYIKRLHEAGVRTSCFLPAGSAITGRQINYRNHSKIAVIDGHVGFIGGMNIGDEYLGLNPKLGFWRDTQLMLKGNAVYFLQELFTRHWAYASGEHLLLSRYVFPHRSNGTERVLIVSSGPDNRKEPILQAVFASVISARNRVYLTTPYFIPDPSLVAALRCAALAGADVRIIVPWRADTQLVLWATLSYVQPLLASGIRVYRYRRGFIHAKVLIVDELVAAVGTANMDMRSFYSNFEQNAFLFDSGAISRLEEDFMRDLADSEELDLETVSARPLRQKAKEAIGHLLSPLL